MNTGEKKLADMGLYNLKVSARTGKAGDICTRATPMKGVPINGQDIEVIDRQLAINL